MNKLTQTEGLYRTEFEHDACGVGFVAHVKGEKSHQQIVDALVMLENMEHRGACGCASRYNLPVCSSINGSNGNGRGRGNALPEINAFKRDAFQIIVMVSV